MNNNKQIIVRLDDETMLQWKNICSTLKGNTRSDVFRKIIKRLHSSIEEISDINSYG